MNSLVVQNKRRSAHSGAGRAGGGEPAPLPLFLAGGHETALGRRICAHDWASTPLGAPAAWPAPLRTAVRLLLSSRHPMLVLWGPQHRALYNDAFGALLGAEAPGAALGLPVHQAWPQAWPVLQQRIEEVMARQDALQPAAAPAAPVHDAAWPFECSALHDDAAPRGIGGVLVLGAPSSSTPSTPSTPAKPDPLAQHSLAEAEARFSSWFENAPGFVCILSGPTHRFAFANRRYRQLVGRRELLGHTLLQALPELAAQGFVVLLDRVYASGEPYAGSAMPMRLAGEDGAAEQRRHIDVVFQPTRDAAGAVTGILVQGTDVTDRVLAATALADSEARYRALAEQLPGGAVFVVDAELRFLMAAGEALASAGFAPADLLGRTIFETMPPALAREAESHYRRAIAGDTFELEHAGGNDRFFLTRGAPLRGAQGQIYGVLAVSFDITSRRRAEEGLRHAQAQLDSVIAAAEAGVWAWDLRRNVFQHDANLARLYGLPASGESTPQQHLQRIHPDDHAPMQAAVKTALQEGVLDIREYRVTDTHGATRWLAARGRVLQDGAGRPERMTGLVIDITELKQLEASLRQSDRQKDEFLAVLAHELRNPLAPLLSATRVLQQEPLPAPELARCRDVIRRQVQQMALLLDDLLDVSRIKHGRLSLKRAPVALADIVDAAVETATPLIQARRHRLSVVLPPGATLLDADAGRMAQVLANLLGNAAKYTEPGGHIELAAERCGAQVALTVRDDGIGLSAADQSQVFRMFTQIDAGRGHTQGGLGIGLALVKGLVDLHGGQVRVVSAGPGLGSAFTVSVPAAAAAVDVVASMAAVAAEPAPASAAALRPAPDSSATAAVKWRILVADDNTDAAETLAMFLRLEGHQTQVVADGLQAVAAHAAWAPDIALVDIGMPGLDGYQVAQHIRAGLAQQDKAGAERVLLVALTGWGQEGDKDKAREAGFDLHFTKPVDPLALLRRLARRLQPGAEAERS